MKNFILLLTVIILLVFGCATTKHINNIESDYWQLVWQEEFNGTRIDTTIWSKISRGGSDWEKHMSSHESLYDVKNGCVILRATKNSVDANDTAKNILLEVSTQKASKVLAMARLRYVPNTLQLKAIGLPYG